MAGDFEKREAMRFRLHLEGTVIRSVDPKPTAIEVGDLSVGGCLIVGWTATPGTVARLRIDLRDEKPPLELRVTVMRQTEWEGNPAAGVRFEEPFPLAAENRLSKAIRMLERIRARQREQALEAAEVAATAAEEERSGGDDE